MENTEETQVVFNNTHENFKLVEDLISKFTTVANLDNLNSQETCPICLDLFNDNTEINLNDPRQLSCNHCFHIQCISD